MPRASQTTVPSEKQTSSKKSEEGEQEKNKDTQEEPEKRTRKISSRTRAKNEIKKLQGSTEPCIRRGSFKRIMKAKLRGGVEEGEEERDDVRIASEALVLAQCVAENVAVKLLESANYNMNLCTKYKRLTLDTVDLMSSVHGNDHLRPFCSEWLDQQRAELVTQKIARDVERKRLAALSKEDREIELKKKKDEAQKKRDEKLKLKAKRKAEREAERLEKAKLKEQKLSEPQRQKSDEKTSSSSSKKRKQATKEVEKEIEQEQHMETTEDRSEDTSSSSKKSSKKRVPKKSKVHNNAEIMAL